MKEQKEEWEAKSNDFELKLQNTEADLAEEKKLRQDEKEASEQQIMVLNNNIAGLEQQKIEAEKMHTAEIDSLKEEHGAKLSQLQREIKLADAAGYQRGIDEMLAKQKGGVEGLASQEAEDENPFGVKQDGPPQKPDVAVATEDSTELTMMNEYGIPSSIARIDSRSGMLMLPIGSERGLNQGEIFTLWKGKSEAARIKVQSTQRGIRWLTFCLSLVNRTVCAQAISYKSFPKNKTLFELDNLNGQVSFPLLAFKPFLFVERLFHCFPG